MEAGGAAVPVGGDRIRADVVPHERVRAMLVRYTVATTAFLLVAGLLGLIMRQSQGDLVRLDDNFFYAAMTAHGLGAFVAWAGFAVMGFGYWVLQSVGFPMRPFAYRFAELTFWAMVAGTLGIVVSTLFMGFGASWVFLYPLPFNAAGEWGDAATALFSVSVLLAGVAIITWCVSILAIVTGPSLPAASDRFLNRVGVAVGLGVVFPKRFPLREGEPFPYAILPLTVIAVDMLIATTPLAVLLVEMTIQSFAPSVTVDPLLAKNILWFFGHPVVYLLLFPAVAIYYLLIPRYAGRELVAGRIIGVAWLLAVVVNVIIWAHHVYLDYPEGTVQAAINTAMQPLTFSIAIVSALSLYSLSATIWKSDFDWNPAAKFLVAGMFGWFTAGLSGVVNATIAFQEDIHNTLWVVGHFHHMALLNIGMVVFAGVYAFLPELTGRAWYSRRLADWHLWGTLIGGYGSVVLWLSQGLTGGPRRWAVLPDVYDPQTIAAMAFVLLIGLAQLVFVWNIVQTMRGRVRRDDEQSVLRDERQLVLGFTLSIAFVVPLFAVAIDQRETAEPQAARAGASGGGAGQELFVQSCGGCHVLQAAGSSGTTGPSLDALQPDSARVLRAIEQGGAGTGNMPPKLLQGAEARQVADYVARQAGGG
jgi:cytochrome c oxidase subunit 1